MPDLNSAVPDIPSPMLAIMNFRESLFGRETPQRRQYTFRMQVAITCKNPISLEMHIELLKKHNTHRPTWDQRWSHGSSPHTMNIRIPKDS
jgi:hypothetical protein